MPQTDLDGFFDYLRDLPAADLDATFDSAGLLSNDLTLGTEVWGGSPAVAAKQVVPDPPPPLGVPSTAAVLGVGPAESEGFISGPPSLGARADGVAMPMAPFGGGGGDGDDSDSTAAGLAAAAPTATSAGSAGRAKDAGSAESAAEAGRDAGGPTRKPKRRGRRQHDYRGPRHDPLDPELLALFSTAELRLPPAQWAALLEKRELTAAQLVRVKQLRRRSKCCVYSGTTRKKAHKAAGGPEPDRPGQTTANPAVAAELAGLRARVGQLEAMLSGLFELAKSNAALAAAANAARAVAP